MIPWTKRLITLAVSSTVSLWTPICILDSSMYRACPPSSVMATSKEILVRVLGFSKIMARVFPLRESP